MIETKHQNAEFKKLLREDSVSDWIAFGKKLGYEEEFQEGFQKGFQEGFQEGFQDGLREGRQEGLRKTLLVMMSKRFCGFPDNFADKLQRIKKFDLLQGWVVNFSEYKKLKNFEQDVDAALSQQVMA
jgi:flagellar biosynthesis/type III secretory pathway protein FliH